MLNINNFFSNSSNFLKVGGWNERASESFPTNKSIKSEFKKHGSPSLLIGLKALGESFHLSQ